METASTALGTKIRDPMKGKKKKNIGGRVKERKTTSTEEAEGKNRGGSKRGLVVERKGGHKSKRFFWTGGKKKKKKIGRKVLEKESWRQATKTSLHGGKASTPPRITIISITDQSRERKWGATAGKTTKEKMNVEKNTEKRKQQQRGGGVEREIQINNRFHHTHQSEERATLGKENFKRSRTKKRIYQKKGENRKKKRSRRKAADSKKLS